MSIKPNFEDCQGCAHWDDVNGCWLDSNPANCPCLDDEGNLKDDN